MMCCFDHHRGLFKSLPKTSIKAWTQYFFHANVWEVGLNLPTVDHQFWRNIVQLPPHALVPNLEASTASTHTASKRSPPSKGYFRWITPNRSKFWSKCAKYKIIWTFGFWSFSISIALHPCKQDLDVRYRNLAPQDEKYREILNENELCWICRCLLQRSLCWSHHGRHGKPFYTPDVSNPQQFVFSLLLSEIKVRNKKKMKQLYFDGHNSEVLY